MLHQRSKLSLPAGFDRIILYPDRAFAWGDKNIVANSCLSINGNIYKFSESAECKELAIEKAHDIAFKPSEVSARNIVSREVAKVSAFVNKLEDWSLPDSNTLQILVNDFHRSLEIQILPLTTISMQPGKYELSFLAATHHCDVVVILEYFADGKLVKEDTVRIEASFIGGRVREKYQEIAFNAEVADPGVTYQFRMKLISSGQLTDSNPINPFIFLADLKFCSRSSGADLVSGGLEFGFAKITGRSNFICTAPVSSESNVNGIHLRSPSGEVCLLDSKSVKMSMLENQGHTLIFSSDSPGIFSVFINNRLSTKASFGDTPCSINLPSEFLTGEMVFLKICDEWGIRTFFQDYIVLPRILTPHEVMLRESRPPFPSAPTAIENFRYKSLKEHLKAGSDKDILDQLPWVLQVLEGGYENVQIKPLSFPKVDQPDVSIIIPAHNKVEATYTALCALLLSYNKSKFEIIVVDDASDDDTISLHEYVKNVTFIRNDVSQRFIRSCNAAAKVASGKFLALLNNDTEPTCFWIDELLEVFNRFEDVGLVGSKLIYPDGNLQEAGGIVWKSGNPWNYGKGKNPWDPRFNYAREVDYVSGAAMLVAKDLWEKLDGLSSYLEPMYFEDTDFAFKVRDAGLKVFFAPFSVVYHHEGLTSGTDLNSGLKSNQLKNAPKFKKKWIQKFRDHPKEGTDPDFAKDSGILGRVLFLDYATPRPDLDAGSYAALQEMSLVQSLGYKVTFLPINLAHLGEYTSELEKSGIETIYSPFTLSVDDFLKSRGGEFDIVYITRYHVAIGFIRKIRESCPHAKILFNNADLHFLRELRVAKAKSDPELLKAAKKTKKEEMSVIENVDVVFSYNEFEHVVIESHTNKNVKVLLAPWVVSSPSEVPSLHGRVGLSFVGSYQHYPNEEAVKWFASEVCPLLNENRQDTHLHIYGSGMKKGLKDLNSDSIFVEGYISNISDAYNKHKIFIAPLISGAGIKGKVLSAIAHGIPTIVSPIAAEGIGLRDGSECLIASSPQEWVNCINSLNADEDLWSDLSNAGRKLTLERYSFERGRDHMKAAFDYLGCYNYLA